MAWFTIKMYSQNTRIPPLSIIIPHPGPSASSRGSQDVIRLAGILHIIPPLYSGSASVLSLPWERTMMPPDHMPPPSYLAQETHFESHSFEHNPKICDPEVIRVSYFYFLEGTVNKQGFWS